LDREAGDLGTIAESHIGKIDDPSSAPAVYNGAVGTVLRGKKDSVDVRPGDILRITSGCNEYGVAG
jgi:hypothetical protein